MTSQPPPGAPPGAWQGMPSPFPAQPLMYSAPQPPPKRVRSPRRHRGVFWVAVLTSLVAVVAGTFVAVTTYVSATAPDTIATNYFRALSRGDAAAALAYGDVPAGPRTYLTRGVLRAALEVASISDVSALSVDRDGDAATVTVQYQLSFRDNQKAVTDTVILNRHGRSWRLAATAASIQIIAKVAGHRLTLAGSALPAGSVLMFPGALPLSVDTPNLEIDEQVLHLTDKPSRTLRPMLSKAGTPAVQSAVVSAVRACLGTNPSPSCPVPTDARVVPGTVHGTLTGDLGDELTIQVTGPDGLLDVRGSVAVRGSFQRLDFDNLPAAKSGTTDLAIRAHCYAVNPSKLVWGAP
ncbi:MAG TPA: hypothetical protein VGJ38_04970 [Jatrophihabitantaceae bacterium]